MLCIHRMIKVLVSSMHVTPPLDGYYFTHYMSCGVQNSCSVLYIKHSNIVLIIVYQWRMLRATISTILTKITEQMQKIHYVMGVNKVLLFIKGPQNRYLYSPLGSTLCCSTSSFTTSKFPHLHALHNNLSLSCSSPSP